MLTWRFLRESLSYLAWARAAPSADGVARVDEASARETLALFRELGILDEELGAGTP